MVSIKTFSLMAVAFVASLSALAVPTLKITDQSSNVYTVSSATGVVSGTTTVLDGWFVTYGIGFTAPAIGSASNPLFQLTGSAIRESSSAGSLKFEFFDDIFTASPFQAKLSGSVTGTQATGSIVYSSQLENSPYLSSGSLGFTPGDSSGATVDLVGPSITPALTPYSAGLITTLSVTANNAFTAVGFSSTLSAVPEPGFYGALALGLSGLFAAVARRRAAAKV